MGIMNHKWFQITYNFKYLHQFMKFELKEVKEPWCKTVFAKLITKFHYVINSKYL